MNVYYAHSFQFHNFIVNYLFYSKLFAARFYLIIMTTQLVVKLYLYFSRTQLHFTINLPYWNKVIHICAILLNIQVADNYSYIKQ